MAYRTAVTDRFPSNLALLLLAVAACDAPPGAEPPGPGTRFDARRAIEDARAIGALGPRPTGSDASARAREHLVGELREIGAAIEVVDWSQKNQRLGLVGQGKNVVARLKGRHRGATLVSARYDDPYPFAYSAASPDGADAPGALGAAILLEIARAIRAGGEPEHDVLLLATDGSEGQLGQRAFVRSGRDHRVRVQVHLCVRGDGPALLLWASRGAQEAVDAYARWSLAPEGGSHLHYLVGPRETGVPATTPWPTVVLGTAPRALGSPQNRVGATLARDVGQSALDLVRALDRTHLGGRHAAAPSFLDLPLHIVVPVDAGTSSAIAWIALLASLLLLLRARRSIGALFTALPWLLIAFAGAIAVMAAASEVVREARGSGIGSGHLATMVLWGVLWLLAWQRVGILGPARRLAVGLSNPLPLLGLSVALLAIGTIAARLALPLAAHLFWGPLVLAAIGLAWSSAAATRGRRFGGAALAAFGAVSFWIAPLEHVVAILRASEPLASLELAAVVALLALPIAPSIAATAVASVLRPGAGQLTLVALIATSVGIWSATEPVATRSSPRRVDVTAVTVYQPGRSLFALRGEARVSGRAARLPWFARGLGSRALVAPDSLSIPPHVQASLSPGAEGWLLDVRVRPLRRADAITLVLSPRVRVLRASLPTVRWKRKDPWTARFIDPPRTGFRFLAWLDVPRGVGLGDFFALDEGPADFAPLAPPVDRSMPTRVVLRAVGVTPLDATYARPPPPPPLPPDIPPPEPAGPEPWWTIMATERFRR